MNKSTLDIVSLAKVVKDFSCNRNIVTAGALWSGVESKILFVLIMLALVVIAPRLVTAKESDSAQTQQQGDKKSIGKISIIGNSEMPKASFNIPWQSPTIPKEINDPPPASLKGMLEPIEPDQHRNRLYFQDNLKLDVQELKSR